MSIKKYLMRIHWVLSSQLGLNPLRLMRSLRGLPEFISGWWSFRSVYKGRIDLLPCLYDRYEEGGSTKNEYFWQDLIVARWVHQASPQKHVDIGSRVDGFVAHVASFREVEVIDVRPITTDIPGVVFRQADMMNVETLPDTSGDGYCDSLSCLHALEHFGLGRYGDPINPLGFRLGFENMVSLLRQNGMLYLSTPIGVERVEFNANWIFNPHTILKIASDTGLQLKSLTVFDRKRGIQKKDLTDATFKELASEQYNLGIFTFTKILRRT
jgi:hypothetical protein